MKPETCLEQAAAPLAAATEQVLETMFFTTIDGPLECVPETAPEIAGEIVSAVLLFRGGLSGVFRLDVSLASARRMTAAFLADEPEHLPPARVEETVCELANMICGCALSHIRGESIFELLSPHLSGADDRLSPSAASATRIFRLEDGFLRVSVEVR